MEYEYLSHTADVKVRAYGADFAGAARSAARAVTDLLTDVHNVEPKQRRRVDVRAGRKEALLYDYLSELVYHKDVSGFVACDAELTLHREEAGWRIEGDLLGDELKHYENSGDVKAATYHDMHIEEGERTMLEFVLDI